MCDEGCVLFEEVRRLLDAGRFAYLGCFEDVVDLRRAVANISILFPEEDEKLCLQAHSWQDGLPVSLIEPHPSPVGTVWSIVHAYPERLHEHASEFASRPNGFVIQDADCDPGFLPPSLASPEPTPEPRDVSRRRATPFPSRARGTSEIPEPSTSVRVASEDPRPESSDCPSRAERREAWLRDELSRQLGADSPLSPIAEHGSSTPTTYEWSPRSPSYTVESPVYSPRLPASAEVTAEGQTLHLGLGSRLPSPLPSCHASAGPAVAYAAGQLVLAYEDMTARYRESGGEVYGGGQASPRVGEEVTAAPSRRVDDFDDASVPQESRGEALARMGRSQSLPLGF